MNRTAWFSLVVALTLLALGIRASYVARVVVENPVRADAAQYLRYGYNLAFHGVYSSAASQGSDAPESDSFRSPGYPLQLAAVLSVVDNAAAFYRTQLAIQAFLSALVVPILILLARRTMREAYALAVGLLIALMPHQVTSSGYLLTETLQSLLFAACLLAFVMSLERHKSATAAVAGILFGLLYLTNEATLLVAPLLVALVWLRGHEAREPGPPTCDDRSSGRVRGFSAGLADSWRGEHPLRVGESRLRKGLVCGG